MDRPFRPRTHLLHVWLRCQLTAPTRTAVDEATNVARRLLVTFARDNHLALRAKRSVAGVGNGGGGGAAAAGAGAVRVHRRASPSPRDDVALTFVVSFADTATASAAQRALCADAGGDGGGGGDGRVWLSRVWYVEGAQCLPPSERLWIGPVPRDLAPLGARAVEQHVR
eukprot:CAMPEP_0198330014 /NCGR_PEP_ID=MMETSP1450-20131203/16616_1 /TAXON_ID=753684 ORGANISM="Madagascaria erythrocladiodes, Strain CCMP3234" /NCGR_SAMPLE_ID=MMETSP1450 /ASSEMBLY_ACC=CAM_ASM_001115 /LENGTH=168 /DNA_ID=CAMNT_0044034275 /DNA_START=13 /DNA_END=515 /DNA_ORIENTATION=-